MAEEREWDFIARVRAQLPPDEVVQNLADVFKVFGDATRTKILSCLRKLVKGEKQGKEVLYSLDDDHVTQIMECGLTHINERD